MVKLKQQEFYCVSCRGPVKAKADIGCNSVLNPGTIIGPQSIVYPNSSWRGTLPPKHIAKLRQSFETVERKD